MTNEDRRAEREQRRRAEIVLLAAAGGADPDIAIYQAVAWAIAVQKEIDRREGDGF